MNEPTLAPPRAPGARSFVALHALAIGGAVAALCFCKATDPDLGFHLATGRAVLALGKIPALNVLSYTEPEHPWLLHQGPPAVLFELVHRSFGMAGLLAVKTVVVVATWLVVWAAARRALDLPAAARAHARSEPLAALLTVAGATAASLRFVERPLLFSNLAMAVETLVVVRYLEAARDGDRRGVKRALGLGALTAAIACHLHAGAVSALLFLFAAAAGVALEPLRARLSGGSAPAALEPSGSGAAWPLAAAATGAFAAAAATLALYHPHGVRALAAPFSLASDPYQVEHVGEFRAPTAFPFAVLASYWLLAAGSLALVVARRREVHLALVALYAMVLLLSLRHARLIYDFAIVAVPVTAAAIATTRSAGALVARPRARALVVALLALACVAGPVRNWSLVPFGVGWADAAYPRALFDVVRGEGVRGPAFVSDGWAGLFLGEFYPEERSFFDMRLDAYSPAFARDVYQHVRYGLPGWRAQLDRYGVELVLLKYTSAREAELQRGEPNLRQRLAADPDFRLIAFDDLGELFVRVKGRNAAVAERLGLVGLDPDRTTFLGPPRLSWPSLERAVAREPRSIREALLASAAAADAGDGVAALALLEEVERRAPDAPELPAARAFVAQRAQERKGASSKALE